MWLEFEHIGEKGTGFFGRELIRLATADDGWWLQFYLRHGIPFEVVANCGPTQQVLETHPDSADTIRRVPRCQPLQKALTQLWCDVLYWNVPQLPFDAIKLIPVLLPCAHHLRGKLGDAVCTDDLEQRCVHLPTFTDPS